MKIRWSVSLTVVVLCAAVMLSALLGAGCGESKPKVMVFMGKSSQSYDAMKSLIDNLRKKYEDKVTFVIVDYDNAENKDLIKEYHVSMNPTVLIFNTEGKIKETYMGTAREEMLGGSIESYIPKKKTTTSSQPGSMSAPLMPPSVSTSPTGTNPAGVSGTSGQ